MSEAVFAVAFVGALVIAVIVVVLGLTYLRHNTPRRAGMNPDTQFVGTAVFGLVWAVAAPIVALTQSSKRGVGPIWVASVTSVVTVGALILLWVVP